MATENAGLEIHFPLQGERLLIRPFEADDAVAAHAMYSDIEVMRYVAEGQPNPTIAATEAMLRGYVEHQREHGFAFWAVFDASSGEFVGDAGFESHENDEVDFGYTLMRSWWGKGCATEAARLCLAAISPLVNAEHLVALVDPLNVGSGRVLEKVGFCKSEMRMAYGRPHQVFRMNASKEPFNLRE